MIPILEYWKPIIGYNERYWISSYGRIWSTCNGGHFMSIQYNKRINIYEVHLKMNGNRKCYSIHRLVALHFVSNNDHINKTTVNHIDGDRSHNYSSNLEWVSYSENLKHAYDSLNRPKNRASKHYTNCKSIDNNGNEREYKSVAQASRETGISETQIRRLLSKECKNKKYEFMYI